MGGLEGLGMTKVFYGKRRYVPLSCPECDEPHYSIADIPEFDGYDYIKYNYLLKCFGCEYMIGLAIDPDWRMPRWYGECRRCKFMEMIREMRKDRSL